MCKREAGFNPTRFGEQTLPRLAATQEPTDISDAQKSLPTPSLQIKQVLFCCCAGATSSTMSFEAKWKARELGIDCQFQFDSMSVGDEDSQYLLDRFVGVDVIFTHQRPIFERLLKLTGHLPELKIFHYDPYGWEHSNDFDWRADLGEKLKQVST